MSREQDRFNAGIIQARFRDVVKKAVQSAELNPGVADLITGNIATEFRVSEDGDHVHAVIVVTAFPITNTFNIACRRIVDDYAVAVWCEKVYQDEAGPVSRDVLDSLHTVGLMDQNVADLETAATVFAALVIEEFKDVEF